MTQLSHKQAVKLANLQQKEIERLDALVASKDAALHALGRETRGSILLNWHLVNEKGGEVRVPAKMLVDISSNAKFGYRYDEATDEYVFLARIEEPSEPSVIVVPPSAANEPVVEATYTADETLPGDVDYEYHGPELTEEVRAPEEE